MEYSSEAYLDQIAVNLGGGVYFTHRELHAAFDRVKNSDNWKMPVDCLVTEPDFRARNAIHVAIRYFTGSESTAEVLGGGQYRFRAAGYYLTIGA